MSSTSPRNALAGTTSPYLLQHADNPVAWYPWGETALQRARREDRPILLSIGYSACHWCHVMAHESFADETVAAVMNEHFINIKVDREERPDIDHIYQLAHQMLTRRTGGWPLTVFLDPSDLTPFFAGTYFPKKPRHGLPGFTTLLQRIAAAYREERTAIHEQNQQLRAALHAVEQDGRPAQQLDQHVLRDAIAEFAEAFDYHYGGTQGAPKFPRPGDVRFFLHQAQLQEDSHSAQRAAEMARLSLDAMAAGGLYDHLEGGFFRYCVDGDWTIPHFEKMLYDNAQLLDLYAAGAIDYQRPEWCETVLQTAAWAARRLHINAAYAASLDADSADGEGAYYVWTRQQLDNCLNSNHHALFKRAYGLDRQPNFEHRQWHLKRFVSDHELAAETGLAPAQIRQQLALARAALARQRDQRPPPGRDHKILTSWNALMIHGLARAGLLLHQPELVQHAAAALDHLHHTVWRNGRLYAVRALEHTHTTALLEDHAYLLQAIMALLQCRFRNHWLAWARQLADILLHHFQDKTNAGFYMTPHDHEPLISRPKPWSDDALPAGNAAAIIGLWQLGELVGEPRYLHAAERAVHCGWEHLRQHPRACAGLLLAAATVMQPGPRIILTGPAELTTAWRQHLKLPANASIYALPADDPLPPSLAAFTASNQPRAYLCHGTHCLPPADTLHALQDALNHRLRFTLG